MKPGKPGGFRRFWRRAPAPAPGLLKWGPGSSAVEGVPADLVEGLRDELGRLNQRAGTGPDCFVTVTINAFGKRWWGATEVSYELVARDGNGQLVWVADDTVRPSARMALTAADHEVDIIAREVGRRLRTELGLQ